MHGLSDDHVHRCPSIFHGPPLFFLELGKPASFPPPTLAIKPRGIFLRDSHSDDSRTAVNHCPCHNWAHKICFIKQTLLARCVTLNGSHRPFRSSPFLIFPVEGGFIAPPWCLAIEIALWFGADRGEKGAFVKKMFVYYSHKTCVLWRPVDEPLFSQVKRR